MMRQQNGTQTSPAGALDRGGLEVIDAEQCLVLLDSVPVGRVAFQEVGVLQILPVAHAVDGGSVVFATAAGAKLGAAAARRPVAYEADAYEARTRSGWSVLVQGTADLVADPVEQARLLATALAPWVETFGRAELVRVEPRRITGRRIPRGRPPVADPARRLSPRLALARPQPLEPDECLDLLAAVPLGRVGLVVHDRPVLFPVNHLVQGRDVLFRTAPGSKLDAAQQRAGEAASFEVDDYDAASRSGWSVLVTGYLQPVLDALEVRRLNRLGLDAWADAVPRERWIRLAATRLSGRRLVGDR